MKTGLTAKFGRNLRKKISEKNTAHILSICDDQGKLENTTVNGFMSLFVV